MANYIIYKTNKDCEYPKNECSMHSYSIENIPGEQNKYFLFKKQEI